MKKLVLFLTMVILSSNIVFAQRWELNPQVGFNLGTPCERDYFSKYGFDIGLSGAYRINSFAIETDLIYSWLSDEFNYFYLPVKAKYYVFKGLNIFAGPQIDFGVNNEPFVSVDGGKQLVPNSVLFTVMGGVGYRFNCGLNFSVSYNYKITPTYKNTRNARYEEHMKGFKFTVGRYFKLGR